MNTTVFFDTLANQPGHAHRGIGVYTRKLLAGMKHELDTNSANNTDSPASTAGSFQNSNTVTLVSNAKEATTVHIPTFDLFKPTFPIDYVLKKKKIILTIHDVIPLVFPDYYPAGIKGTLSYFYQKFLLRFVSHIITDSKASAHDIHSYLGVPKNKITPIYLAAGIDDQELSKTQAHQLLKKYSLPERFVLYVGDINYNKNIPSLIESIDYLPEDVALVCIGKNFISSPIPEWQAIDASLQKIKNKNRVYFITDLGSDATKTLAVFYQSAVVYVQPSFYEGFGLPVLEAMQYGTPVIAAKNSSLREVGGEVAIFTQPTSSGIAQAIQYVLTLDDSVRTMLGSESKKWAKTFSWQKAAQETILVYKNSANTILKHVD